MAKTPALADFTFGNPQEMPLPAVVDALKKHAEPLRVDWFAYKTNESDACEFVAGSLSRIREVKEFKELNRK